MGLGVVVLGMTNAADRSPALSEFQALSNADLLTRYRGGLERIERRLLDLTHGQCDTSFSPSAGVGRWSCRVLMGHLADAELVFVHRVRRTVAEDRPVLAVWDENAFIDGGVYGDEKSGAARPVAAFVAVMHTLRMWHGEWMLTLGRDEWARVALHPERGEQSVRTIMDYATWHLEHHAWYLSRKLAALLGPA